MILSRHGSAWLGVVRRGSTRRGAAQRACPRYYHTAGRWSLAAHGTVACVSLRHCDTAMYPGVGRSPRRAMPPRPGGPSWCGEGRGEARRPHGSPEARCRLPSADPHQVPRRRWRRHRPALPHREASGNLIPLVSLRGEFLSRAMNLKLSVAASLCLLQTSRRSARTTT